MKKTTILIVEDEVIVAADLASKLDRLGYEVVGSVAKGEDALDMACRLQPRLVLMDIQLKGNMDGIETAEAIRKHVDLPIVFLTSYSDAATLERAKLSNPFGYILKPYEDRELTKTIEMAFYRHQSDRQLSEQREWLRVTLTSIGEGVITCNTDGLVTFLNPVAEALTEWSIEDARNQPIRKVLRLMDLETRRMTQDPVSLVLDEGRPVAAASHTALITRDFLEIPIEHSAAPIHSTDGETIGVVFVFRDVTEKRRAQEALQEGEARLQAANQELHKINEDLQAANEELQSQQEELQVLNEEMVTVNAELQEKVVDLNKANSDMENLLASSGIATLFLDRQLTIKGFTPAMARLLNLIPVDIGRPFLHLAGGINCLGLSEDTAATLSNAVPMEREITGIENGSCHLMRVFPYRIPDGGVDGFVITLVDITALKKSEERLRHLSDNLPDSLLYQYMREPGGSERFVYISAGVERLNGVTAEAVLRDSNTLRGQFLPEYVPLVAEAVERSARDFNDFVVEAPMHTPDKQIRWMRMHSRPRRLPDGCIVWDGVQSDVTARRQAEERLRKLSVAIEQSPTAIVITDVEGLIEFVNPRFKQITGYSAEEVIGCNPRMLQGDTSESTYKELWSTLTGGNVWEGTFHNRKKDGTYFWERNIISPIRNKSGDITHYLAIKEDITERRSLGDQLRQAQKMEALGQLAGGVAHDFNNILQVILGYAYILSNDANPGQKEKINEILKATERAGSLTNGLLAYSRKQVFKIEPCDVNTILKDVQKFLGRILGEDIHLSIGTSQAPLVAAVDRSHLQQVFVNLASNSRDAMPSGGKLSISLDRMDMDEQFVNAHGFGAAGSYALISVSDTGEGISIEHMDKIFEPFFTTKGDSKGTGLGLSIVYGIVSQLNGFITCESVIEQGTTFRIYLPLDYQAQAPEESVHEHHLHETEGATILIVEDESAVRQIIRTILEKYGYAVIEGASGREAIEQFRRNQEKIDLVLLDAIMPEINGAETLRSLREIKPGLKALFMSGYAREIVSGKMLLPDDVDLLSKPVKPVHLIEAVRNAI